MDIIAIQEILNVESKYLIECKRKQKKHSVGVGTVREFYGVHTAEKANKSIIAATSFFTSTAKEFAETCQWQLDLRDYDDVIGWIKAYRE